MINPNDVVISAIKQPQKRSLLGLLSAESVIIYRFYLELESALQSPNYADEISLPIIKCGVTWSDINIF